jgi:hypothetical protein
MGRQVCHLWREQAKEISIFEKTKSVMRRKLWNEFVMETSRSDT